MKKLRPKPKLESFRDRLVIAGSSALGLGLVPVAPGTFGTLAAFPLWWLLDGRPLWVWWVSVSMVFGFAVWISHRAEALYGDHDVSAIVIDEVAGMLVCVIAVPLTWMTAVSAFVVFRAFDIVKPPPVRWFDERVSGGFGVVIDDIVAGVMGLAVMHGLMVVFGW